MKRVPLQKLKRWIRTHLTSRRGKFLTRCMSLIEVASLEFITFLDRYLLPGIMRRVMWMMQESWGAVVVPLGVNIDPTVQVSPSEEILEIVRRVKVVAVGNCYCRWRNNDRNYPSETCLILGEGYDLDELAKFDKLVPGTRPRKITIEELKNILEMSDRTGLVHQLIFFPSPRFFYVICNCAPESCTALRNLIRWGTPSVVKSNFIETTDMSRCTKCGTCVTRCPFRARNLEGDPAVLTIDPNRCFGCGICVPKCPADAIKLVRKANVLIPGL